MSFESTSRRASFFLFFHRIWKVYFTRIENIEIGEHILKAFAVWTAFAEFKTARLFRSWKKIPWSRPLMPYLLTFFSLFWSTDTQKRSENISKVLLAFDWSIIDVHGAPVCVYGWSATSSSLIGDRTTAGSITTELHYPYQTLLNQKQIVSNQLVKFGNLIPSPRLNNREHFHSRILWSCIPFEPCPTWKSTQSHPLVTYTSNNENHSYTM